MDSDAPDEPGLAEAEMAPPAAGIGRFVDAVAIGDIEPDRGFPGAGINHIGIRGSDGERADRGRGEKAVDHAAPISAAVGRLPDTAGAGAEVEYSGVFGVTRDGDDAAAARRPDAAPFEGVEFSSRAGELCHGKFLCRFVPPPR